MTLSVYVIRVTNDAPRTATTARMREGQDPQRDEHD
jgi:hypothetical protein